MPNPPDEVVAKPLTIYLAPVGTAFPTVDADPATFDPGWEVLGTEGTLNYDESGVTVSHSETTSDFTPAGSTMPRKRFRTAESMTVKVNLVDIGPDAYAKVMNDAAITTVAASSGIAGTKTFSLFRGDQVNSFAVLLRGMSPVDNNLNEQYQYSEAFVSVNGDAVFKKGDPVMLPVEIEVVHHTNDDVLEIVIETAAAS